MQRRLGGKGNARHCRKLHSRQCRRLHPDEIADQFAVAVEIVRRILRFAYQAQLAALYEARCTPLYPRDYELGGVILRHKLAALHQC
jgi:hypothetical protein